MKKNTDSDPPPKARPVRRNQGLYFLNPGMQLAVPADIGLFNYQSGQFKYYENHLKELKTIVSSPAFAKQNNARFLFKLMSKTDRRFSEESLNQIHQFFQSRSLNELPRYRLSLDHNLQIPNGPLLRVLCHLSPLLNNNGEKLEGILFNLYCINNDSEPVDPLHSFCDRQNLKPLLFKRGMHSILNFSEKRRNLILQLSYGRSIKEIAQKENLSENTVRNRLARCREKLQLISNTQLIKYANAYHCFTLPID